MVNVSNNSPFRHAPGRTVADKKAERKAWVEKHKNGSFRVNSLVKAYRLADIPQHEWDLERGKTYSVIHPVHWTDSASGIKTFYRMMVQLYGCGKHRTDKLGRGLRKQMRMDISKARKGLRLSGSGRSASGGDT